MKVLRFLALLAAVLVVYLAQQILVHASLADLLPEQLIALLPVLRALVAWSTDNLRAFALLMAALGGLVFGLVARPWEAEQLPRVATRLRAPSPTVGWIFVGGALIGEGILTDLIWRGQRETLWMQIAWGVGLAVFVLGCWLVSERGRAPQESLSPRPEQSWPAFLLILGIGALLYTWQLGTLPLRVDGDPASHGLEALAILSGEERRIFAPGWANIPLLAYYPAALGMLLSGDWLIGNRLAGVYAGLLTLLGTWLLGCEIFRRLPIHGEHGELLRDDGRQMALLAAAFAGAGYTFVHFSRLPQYLEPVAWGTLGLWALQRGVRTNSHLALGVSGLLMGLTTTLYYSGRIFPVVAAIWWLGYLLARRRWLRPSRGGVGWSGVFVWAAGALVFVAPFLGYWLREPITFFLRAREVSIFGEASQIHMASVYGVEGLPALLWENFKRVMLTFNLYADTSTHFGYRGPMLDALIAPLLVLAVGFILLNLDRWLSWQILLWLLAVVLVGGVITINAPFWPRLLPTLPAIGLAAALAVDRWRATLVAIGGTWLAHVGMMVAVGVLAMAVTLNWVGYYEERSVYADPATHAGRALRQLPNDSIPFLIADGDNRRARWDDRVVQFLGALPYRDRPRGTIAVDDWPEALPPHSVVLLQPSDQIYLAELEARYPGGTARVERDRLGNPVLILYEVP